MNKTHPKEKELARFGEGDVSVVVAEHLRWCARCRSAVADYRWLQGEIEATLTAAAEAVVVPGPKWWAVQERLFASRRRLVMGRRVSAFASTILAVCLMMSVPNFLGLAVAAQMSQPEVVVVPAPVTAAVSGASVASMATPTPVMSCADAEPSSTPAFVLPPTPPAPET